MNFLKHSGMPFRKTMFSKGLLVLFLVSLSGCVARHMPDWSKVQAVAPETETEVQLYKDSSPHGEQRIKGRFLSATNNTIKLQLKDGLARTLQRSDVRKVLTLRDLAHRWPGWTALGISFVMGGMIAQGDFTNTGQTFLAAVFPAAISAPFFYGSRMGGIYEVPPNHRDWFPQGTNSSEEGTNSSEAGEKKPENSK